VVSSAFAAQAQYQAEMLNLSDIRVAYCRHPISDATSAEMVSKAEETFELASAAIKTDAPIAAPTWAKAGKDTGCSS